MTDKTRERVYHWLWMFDMFICRRTDYGFVGFRQWLHRIMRVVYYGPSEFFVADNSPWNLFLAMRTGNPVGTVVVWTGSKFEYRFPPAKTPMPKIPFEYVYGDVPVIQNATIHMAIGYIDVEGNVVNNIEDL